MRELKFRAWDKRNNKWFHRDLFFISNAGFYSDYRELDDGNSLFDYEYELMQYTGLKDKNENPIYEGDVVDTTYDGSTFIGVVVYDLSELDFKATDGKEHYGQNFQYLPCCDEIEVIGNIHDNPELLGDTK